MSDLDGQKSKAAPGFFNIWMPKGRALNHEEERMILSFIGVQFVSFLVGIGSSLFLYYMNAPITSGLLLFYSFFALISLMISKWYSYSSAQYVAVINVSAMLCGASIFLGREGSGWVYIVVSIVGGEFFLSTSKKNKIVSRISLLLAFGIYLIVDWFRWIPTEVTDENRLFIHRFGIFNILYALVIFTGFVGFFYKKSLEYRGQLERQALALREQFILVSNILNHMKQAIFAIDCNKRVVAPVSLYTGTIFPKQIEGLHINALFFNEKERTEVCTQMNSALDLVFGEDELSWQMLRSNLPPELDLKVGTSDRRMKLSYNDMRSSEGDLEKVLLVVEDVTELRMLESSFQKADEARKREMTLVQQIFRREVQELGSFFRNTARLLSEISSIFEGKQQEGERTNSQFILSEEEMAKILRHFHTIKGNARALGFSVLSSVVHECEGAIHEYRESHQSIILGRILKDTDFASDASLCQVFRAQYEKVSTCVRAYQEVSQRFVKRDRMKPSIPQEQEKEYVSVEEENFNQFKNRVLEWLEDGRPLSWEAFQEQMELLNSVSVQSLVHDKENLVQDLAKTLTKKVRFLVTGDFAAVSEQSGHAIYEALTHALRNSLDHGIETPSERRQAGKSEEGILEVKISNYAHAVELLILDDGRGIDTERVVRKALSKGLISDDQAAALSHQEKLHLIFEAGLSTRDEANEVSGRGVGMDALRASIEEIGGKVELTSQVGQGTRLSLYFPKHCGEASHSEQELGRSFARATG